MKSNRLAGEGQITSKDYRGGCNFLRAGFAPWAGGGAAPAAAQRSFLACRLASLAASSWATKAGARSSQACMAASVDSGPHKAYWSRSRPLETKDLRHASARSTLHRAWPAGVPLGRHLSCNSSGKAAWMPPFALDCRFECRYLWVALTSGSSRATCHTDKR